MNYQMVISCYREDLSWINQVPESIEIIVYLKDQDHNPFPNGTNKKIKTVILPNIGRESHTYTYHINHNYNNLSDRTIFVQGDPIFHSPNFLELLNKRNEFGGFQPLSDRWRVDWQIPPQLSIDRIENTKNYSTKLKIFCPQMSLYNLNPIHFQDNGSGWIYWNSADFLKIKPGQNIIKEFFEMLGIKKLSISDNYPDIYNWCIGACFCVSKDRILFYEKKVYSTLEGILAVDDKGIIHLVERSWAILFGPI